MSGFSALYYFCRFHQLRCSFAIGRYVIARYRVPCLENWAMTPSFFFSNRNEIFWPHYLLPKIHAWQALNLERKFLVDVRGVGAAFSCRPAVGFRFDINQQDAIGHTTLSVAYAKHGAWRRNASENEKDVQGTIFLLHNTGASKDFLMSRHDTVMAFRIQSRASSVLSAPVWARKGTGTQRSLLSMLLTPSTIPTTRVTFHC
jgi:hypothetical protein